MPGCFVVGCKSGYGRTGSYHNFKLPRNASEEIKDKWKTNIPKRADRELDFKTIFICHHHFEDRFIVKTTKITLGEAVVQEIPRKNWKLTDDAVPTIFSNEKIPSYLRNANPSRRPPKQRQTPKRDDTRVVTSGCVTNEMPMEANMSQAQLWSLNELMTIIPPPDWLKQQKENSVIFSKMVRFESSPVPTFYAAIQVEVSEQNIMAVIIIGRDVSDHYFHSANSVNSCTQLQEFLRSVNDEKICIGVKNFNMLSKFNITGGYKCGNFWISDQCKVFPETSEDRCDNCNQLKQNLHLSCKVKSSPSFAILTLRKKNKNSLRSIRRLKKRNTSLKVEKKLLIKKFRAAEITSLEQAIESSNNLDSQFKLALKTAVSLQKAKSRTGKRYPGDWLLQALLLKITSPKAYRHLRREGILPLPHPNYITRLLKGIKCEFGFNQFILDQLQKEFSGKSRQDKQVFLCFDEMKVKETIDFNKATMQFTGFIDYGEFSAEYKSRSGEIKEADHALVFLVRSLNSKLTQPIGAFATKGSAPGNILSKIILSAIVKLEQAGLEVIGVVSDGATNNKAAWRFLNIIGKQGDIRNKICNPVDEKRSVYFLCDVPHIIKCIRNNIHKKTIVTYDNSVVNWGFYQALFDIDKCQPLRAAPKLTAHHVNPGPFQKMSVAKAVQVFSKSVADAIRFYREHLKNDLLKYSESTEDFTRKINALFDALNARVPREGITPDSQGYNVIQEFVRNIKESDTFASDVTIASLRVTLQSTLDIIDYLCNEMGFQYVLTAKLNQDCLEKFFGLIRSFGGDSCHPTITSFGHLYRLLSIYNPTRRAIKGNVRSDEDVNVNVVSYLDMLKSMRVRRKSESEEMEQALERCILSNVVYSLDCSSKVISNHDNLESSMYVCYHLCGFIAFKCNKFTDCILCRDRLSDDTYRPVEASLTIIKDQGGLSYPSKTLHLLLSKQVEPLLSNIKAKTVASKNYVHEILERLSVVNCYDLGCNQVHSEELAVKIILYYITIRLFYFAKRYNREVLTSVTKSKQKIKEGKLQ